MILPNPGSDLAGSRQEAEAVARRYGIRGWEFRLSRPTWRIIDHRLGVTQSADGSNSGTISA
jgi:hypothetical protein